MRLFFGFGQIRRANASRQSTVTAVAEGAVLRMFATTPGNGFGLGQIHLFWCEAGALVRAITKRLRL